MVKLAKVLILSYCLSRANYREGDSTITT